jgi:hypothetical protein
MQDLLLFRPIVLQIGANVHWDAQNAKEKTYSKANFRSKRNGCPGLPNNSNLDKTIRLKTPISIFKPKNVLRIEVIWDYRISVVSKNSTLK